MNTTGRLTIAASLLGIFLVGAATGAVTALGSKQATAEKRLRMENLEGSILAWARSRLELTSEQVERIRPLVDLACEEYRAEQARTMTRVVEIIRASNRRVAAELTTAQAEKLHALEVEHEAYLKGKFGLELPAAR